MKKRARLRKNVKNEEKGEERERLGWRKSRERQVGRYLDKCGREGREVWWRRWWLWLC
jgi:hypothetical protein